MGKPDGRTSIIRFFLVELLLQSIAISTLNLEDYQATDLVVASSCFFQQRLRMFAILYSILSCLVVRSSMTFCWHMQGHRELGEDRHVTQCHFIMYATFPPILMVLHKSGWSNHAI